MPQTFAAGMAVSIMLVVIFFSDPKRVGPPEEKGEEAAVERGTGQELRAILGRAEVVLQLLGEPRTAGAATPTPPEQPF